MDFTKQHSHCSTGTAALLLPLSLHFDVEQYWNSLLTPTWLLLDCNAAISHVHAWKSSGITIAWLLHDFDNYCSTFAWLYQTFTWLHLTFHFYRVWPETERNQNQSPCHVCTCHQLASPVGERSYLPLTSCGPQCQEEQLRDQRHWMLVPVLSPCQRKWWWKLHPHRWQVHGEHLGRSRRCWCIW